MNKYSLDINDYKICKNIKKGAFGNVYEIKNITTDKRYAAKVILTADSEQIKQTIDGEVRIMIQFSHPTMINFIGFSNVDFDDHENITIIMELAKNGSLLDILKSVRNGLADDNYDNTARQIILVGISYGMMQLHQNRVIHRDLKPGNILIDESFHPHITDFGLSKIYELDHSESQSKECGTPGYMAPEVINGDHYNIKADVYSFSIIMYEIITDLEPYPLFEKKIFQLNQKIINENYRPQFTFPINKYLRKLIKKCWSKEPNERPSFETIFQLLAHDQRFYLDDVDVDELENYIDFITGSKIVIRDISSLTFQSKKQKKSKTKTKSKSEPEKQNENQLISDLIEQIERQNKEIQELKKQNITKDDQIKKLNLQIEMKDDQIKKLNLQIQNNDKNHNYDDYLSDRKIFYRNRDAPFEYGKDHIHHLNEDIKETGDYMKDRQLKIAQSNQHRQNLYKRLNDVETKLKEEEKTTTNGRQFFTNYDKPRLDYLDEYLNIQNQLRQNYPETRNELNQRTQNFLRTLYKEYENDQMKTAFTNRLISGLGSYQSNSKVETMIQRIESYLRNVH